MPWKGEKDPYRIWLSEIILQQTQVEQGRAYYEKFLRAFPTITALAAAQDATIYKMWEGLGYYTRCKNLIATARLITSAYEGRFPGTYEEILKLRGVGPYTAAAIASFAFNENRAVVDGNVYRVIARYFGISTPVDSSPGKKLFNELAQTLIDQDGPGVYNQAIMDFGATVCKPKNPLCTSCVQSPECQAFKHGFVNALPVKEKFIVRKERWFYYFIIEVGDSVYIRKREQKDIWQNLYEFVLLEKEKKENHPEKTLLKKLLQHGSYSVSSVSNIYKQQLTHQRISGQFCVVNLRSHFIPEGAYHLVKKVALKDYAFPKFINAFLQDEANKV